LHTVASRRSGAMPMTDRWSPEHVIQSPSYL
jgi:hypothetical protein